VFNRSIVGVLPLCVLFAACGGRIDEFRADNFSTSEVAVIAAAADEWCTASDGRCCAGISDHSDINIIQLVNGSQLDSKRVGEYRPTSALGGTERIMILDDRDAPDWEVVLFRVARHELGHHFGDGSDKDHAARGNAMGPSLDDQPEHLTGDDLAIVGCASGNSTRPSPPPDAQTGRSF
jgi:hypothetical protein